MILKRLKLHNIRSYEGGDVSFEEGTTLLSGDIGTGKSTILIAIEFALFGMSKGVVSGETLLRFGTKEGSVELTFLLKKKEVIIKRTLKRGKNGVAQGTGYMIVDGIKTEYSPIELRSKILDLLGYPESLLTKNKSLIFRYSVYTPQEEMKQIILENKDTRLVTLRQIFNIDKYKKITENAQLYMKHLREKKRFYEGRISNKVEKEKEKRVYDDKVSSLRKEKGDVVKKLESAKKEFDSAKKDVEEKEKIKLQKEKLQRGLEIAETKVKENKKRLTDYEEGVERVSKELSDVKEKVLKEKEKEIPDVEEELKELLEKKNTVEKNISHAEKNISVFEVKISSAKEIIEKITKLDECPLCLQNVKDEHKKDVSGKEQEKVKKFTKAMKDIELVLEKEEEEKKKIEKDMKEKEEVRGKGKLLKLTIEKLEENVKDREKRKEQYEEMKKKIMKEAEEAKAAVEKHSEELKGISFDKTVYKKLKEEYEITRERLHAVEVKNASLEREISSYEKFVESIKKELEEMAKAEKMVKDINEVLNWLGEYFVVLMDNMEKHIMQSLQQTFSDNFAQWFDMLIEDDYLKVRIDDDFTPLVEHNGYDIELMALSGGERTSVALAYRLALNKVITNMIEEIKTKDLIILDEPTDGFSSEQLDKLQDILESVKCRQILVVSHEKKIESFVDRVVSVDKADNSSKIG